MSNKKISGLTCPDCDHGYCRVTDSRPYGNYIRRRRKCMRCATLFTTCEITVHEMQLHPVVLIERLKSSQGSLAAVIATLQSLSQVFDEVIDKNEDAL